MLRTSRPSTTAAATSLIGLRVKPSSLPSAGAAQWPAAPSPTASPIPGSAAPTQPNASCIRVSRVPRAAFSAGDSAGCGQSGTPSMLSSQAAQCGTSGSASCGMSAAPGRVTSVGR